MRKILLCSSIVVFFVLIMSLGTTSFKLDNIINPIRGLIRKIPKSAKCNVCTMTISIAIESKNYTLDYAKDLMHLYCDEGLRFRKSCKKLVNEMIDVIVSL